jgi:gamma-glutamyltranspeptidase
MPQASLAAERILHDGGNAFDAIVAGEAVLGVVQPSANGLGSDAQLLIYDAKAKKVWSLNAEGTAPKLATIDWYKTHTGGKLPVDDGLLSGTVPGVVDAWYVMLSRWGTRSFADCLAQAIELAVRRRRFPVCGFDQHFAATKRGERYFGLGRMRRRRQPIRTTAASLRSTASSTALCFSRRGTTNRISSGF